jgi:hypothetical protein
MFAWADSSIRPSKISRYSENIASTLLESNQKASTPNGADSRPSFGRAVSHLLVLHRAQALSPGGWRRVDANCAAPTGLGINFVLHPALRLRLRAGLSLFRPPGLGPGAAPGFSSLQLFHCSTPCLRISRCQHSPWPRDLARVRAAADDLGVAEGHTPCAPPRPVNAQTSQHGRKQRFPGWRRKTLHEPGPPGLLNSGEKQLPRYMAAIYN